MIESVKIQNFRCFSELEVHGLKPINIIVGDNASGKSAFLEALYMVLEGLPSNSFQLREWRQMGLPDRSAQESSQIWDDLFHNYDSSRQVLILAEDRITLRIYRDSSGVKFDRYSDTGEPGLPSPGKNPNSLTFTRAELAVPALCEYLGPHSHHAPHWLASRFSDLSKEGETAPILDALRSEYSFLKDLSLELDAGKRRPGLLPRHAGFQPPDSGKSVIALGVRRRLPDGGLIGIVEPGRRHTDHRERVAVDLRAFADEVARLAADDLIESTAQQL